MAFLRIEPATNGFVAKYDDPDIEAANRESDDAWQDPEVATVFPDETALMAAMPQILERVVRGEVDRAMERAKDFKGGFEATAQED